MKYIDPSSFLHANKAINKVVNKAAKEKSSNADIKKKLIDDGKPATKNDVSIYRLEELLTNTDIQIGVALNIFSSIGNVKDKSNFYKTILRLDFNLAAWSGCILKKLNKRRQLVRTFG